MFNVTCTVLFFALTVLACEDLHVHVRMEIIIIDLNADVIRITMETQIKWRKSAESEIDLEFCGNHLRI